MEYREKWAVSLERIEGFFHEQPDTEAASGGFHYRSCRISLTALPSWLLGPVMVPYTLVEMSGGDEDTETIHRRFFLRFVSAGG